MPFYMKIEDIQGEVTIKNYNGWIALTDFEFTVSLPIESSLGDEKTRNVTKPSFSDIEIEKKLE